MDKKTSFFELYYLLIAAGASKHPSKLFVKGGEERKGERGTIIKRVRLSRKVKE